MECAIAPSPSSVGPFDEVAPTCCLVSFLLSLLRQSLFYPGSGHQSPSPNFDSPASLPTSLPASPPSWPTSSRSSLAQLRSLASSRNASLERTRRDYASLAGPKHLRGAVSPDHRVREKKRPCLMSPDPRTCLLQLMQAVPVPQRRRANTEPVRPLSSTLTNVRMASPHSRLTPVRPRLFYLL